MFASPMIARLFVEDLVFLVVLLTTVSGGERMISPSLKYESLRLYQVKSLCDSRLPSVMEILYVLAQGKKAHAVTFLILRPASNDSENKTQAKLDNGRRIPAGQ